MRVVVQRVEGASVAVDGNTIGEIKDQGFLILLGVTVDDYEEDVAYLVRKIMNLRVFNDENGKMNLNIQDIGGEVLVISQFTLYGDCRKGNRPSYDKAASPEKANELYKEFITQMKESGLKIEEGEFGANMQVNLTNSGPVTIMLDSKKLF